MLVESVLECKDGGADTIFSGSLFQFFTAWYAKKFFHTFSLGYLTKSLSWFPRVICVTKAQYMI